MSYYQNLVILFGNIGLDRFTAPLPEELRI
jgi:hypothetical protein